MNDAIDQGLSYSYSYRFYLFYGQFDVDEHYIVHPDGTGTVSTYGPEDFCFSDRLEAFSGYDRSDCGDFHCASNPMTIIATCYNNDDCDY